MGKEIETFGRWKSITFQFRDENAILDPNSYRHPEQVLCVWYVCMYVLIVITYTAARVRINGGKVANPARGQLNKKNEYFPVRVRA